MNNKQEKFSIELKVRDYECDMQGIVNNAVYLNYLEHARHEFLESLGVSFKQLTQAGIYLVAMKSEQIYKKSLISGQFIRVTCEMFLESKFKVRFNQEVYDDRNTLVLQGHLIAGAIDGNKKPIQIEKIKSLGFLRKLE